MFVATFIALLSLSAIHLYGPRFTCMRGLPRSRWLSLAGGASVAYVFLHLLPELERRGRAVSENMTVDPLNGKGIYLAALLGLVVFYGLEWQAWRSRRQRVVDSRIDRPGIGTFRLHVVAFALYNALIGYLLVHPEPPTLSALVLFTVAIALHFIVNDCGLQYHHEDDYRQRGRWALVAAISAGWVTGMTVEMPDQVLALLMGFLGGGIILNVFKEELPSERESRFSAFLLGAVAYALLLLAI